MYIDTHREEEGEMSDDSSSDVELLSTQPPIKKGLSKYYKGKSQSFTSFSEVESVEDLAKKRYGSVKMLKYCKSYGGELDDVVQQLESLSSPRAVSSKGSCASSARSCKPPHIPMQKNFRCS